MSFFDAAGSGACFELDKDARRRKSARDERWRRAIEKRSEWPPEQFQEEEERLAKEIEDWADRKAA
ncbi:hypothetical protein [Ruegeria sp. HKCCSP351]|uniref:hypothetical protein n=1 Tax=Ruegeria sp. HKCCSP351 TaxID=2794832 RepID=UPI001AE541F3|nr:hypothetical protein [Ruegeria sp. HKCCSP351]